MRLFGKAKADQEQGSFAIPHFNGQGVPNASEALIIRSLAMSARLSAASSRASGAARAGYKPEQFTG